MDSILVLQVVLRKEISDRKDVPGADVLARDSERPYDPLSPPRMVNVLRCKRRALFAMLLGTVSFSEIWLA